MLPSRLNVIPKAVQVQLRSFTMRKLPPRLCVRMAKAGFVALNSGYCCFSCGLILKDVSEDPFFEHARLNPLCRHLGMVKSRGYIEYVTVTYTDERKPKKIT